MSGERHIELLSEEQIFGKIRKPSEIEVGMLQMHILWMLTRKSMHGYELMKNLNAIKSTKVTQGTLYPTLQKLEEYELIKRENLERRIMYNITRKGKKVMNDASIDFCRTFYGLFQDFVCGKCVGHVKGEKQ